MQFLVFLISIFLTNVKCDNLNWRSVTGYKMNLNTVSAIPSFKDNPKSVNLALETSFLLEPKDFNQNINFITNLRSFLDKLTNILEPQSPTFRSVAEKPQYNFDQSIQYLTEAISKLSNTEWKNIYHVFAKEFDKYDNSKPKKRSDHSDDMADALNDLIKKVTTIAVSNKIDKVLNDYSPILNIFRRRFSVFFTEKDNSKFSEIISKVRRFFEKHNNDIKLIVDDVIKYGKEQYAKLDEKTKVSLVKGIKKLTEIQSQKNRANDINDDFPGRNDESENEDDGLTIEVKPETRRDIHEIMMDHLEYFVQPQLINM